MNRSARPVPRRRRSEGSILVPVLLCWFLLPRGATIAGAGGGDVAADDEACSAGDEALGDLRASGGAASRRVSFTSAAVEPIAADAPSSLFLASFVPIDDQSRWPGSIRDYVQPLPVVENDAGELVPDASRVCSAAHGTSCLAWDAALTILDQAPDAAEVVNSRRIGTGADQRRVTYTKAATTSVVPRPIRAFDYANGDARADEYDLWQAMGIAYVTGDSASEAAARAEARGVIRQTLAERTALLDDPGGGGTAAVTYVLGDVFHSDPVLLGGPASSLYLASDLGGNGRSCIDRVRPNRGYRCFFEKERRRRKVLLAASNDGQLHAFDAGIYRGAVRDQRLVGAFDSGTGRELFAHIPRPMLLHTRNMTMLEHHAGIDGRLAVDDVFIDPVHAGVPSPAEREWRTVVIGSYREGSSGLFALDLTHPDPVQSRTVSGFAGRTEVEFVPLAATSAVPTCSVLARSLPSGCVRPYPAVLWEFADPDLGSSWSKPSTGRVLVRTGPGAPEPRFVAVFGGGLDRADARKGAFLYMVDIETGRALWKRAVAGAVPSEPAAVDTDRDGLLDTIYVGTTAGFLYKVDLETAGDLNGATGTVDDPGEWRPFLVFDTGGRPIFFRPTVIFDESSGRFAIAFGTGDRADLWSRPLRSEAGRFYLIVDPGWVGGEGRLVTGPLDESSLERIPLGAGADARNLVTAPPPGSHPGWVLELGDDERLVSDALAVSGLLSFTTFTPEHSDACDFGGTAKVYKLLTTNANAAGNDDERAVALAGLAGIPVVTPMGFARTEGSGPATGDAGSATDPFDAAAMARLTDGLKGLFPKNCRFGRYSLNVSSGLSSGAVLPIARIPVCVATENWTEYF